ncbi:hypothetical protein DERP_008983, partial [Dermatophagoides pteronyssinus]
NLIMLTIIRKENINYNQQILTNFTTTMKKHQYLIKMVTLSISIFNDIIILMVVVMQSILSVKHHHQKKLTLFLTFGLQPANNNTRVD